MKTPEPKNMSQKLVGEVHLTRIRLAKAEGQLATAKEMARVARRRRKEAKQAARRTKKQVRVAKREVTDAKLALAEAEDKLARLNQRPLGPKPRKKPVKKVANGPRKRKLAAKVATHSREAVRPKKRCAVAVSKVAGKSKPAGGETLDATASARGSTATAEFAEGVGEISAAKIETTTLTPPTTEGSQELKVREQPNYPAAN